MSLWDKFWAKVKTGPGCWEWMAARTHNGYGIACRGKSNMRAHRMVMEWFVGPLERGQQVLHRCDNRKCVRPDHLFVGSAADNSADMKAKGRQAHGEGHYASKLTDIEALDIYIRAWLGPRGMCAALAREYGVSRTVASDIKNGRTWTHATGHERRE